MVAFNFKPEFVPLIENGVNMIIHDMEQGTPEWHAVRKLKLTASKAQAIATGGAGLETLCFELVADYLSSGEKEQYTNDDIERGKALESEARNMYELYNNIIVKQVGFIEHDEFCGCSPDGLIGDDGLLEIKSPNDKNYIKYMYHKKIETAYDWQIQMQLLVTGRKWCDFMAYSPNFTKSFVIDRFYPVVEKQEKLIAGIDKGTILIKKILDDLK